MPPSAEATSVNVTVTHCALVTPVSPTVTTLPAIVGSAAVPTPSVTAAFAAVTGLSKVKTIVAVVP